MSETRNTENLTVRYSNSRLDFLWLIFYIVPRSGIFWLVLFGANALVLSTVIGAPFWVKGSSVVKVAFLLVQFLSTFIPLLLFMVGVTFVWMIFSTPRGALGEHQLEIRDEGLIERTEFNETLHRWGAFCSIQTTQNYLYIFLSSQLVHAVPLRCFPSKEVQTRFIHEVRRRNEAGGSVSLLPKQSEN